MDPNLVRANEIPVLSGYPGKLFQCIGALKDIDLLETLEWMLNAHIMRESV